MNLFKLNQLLSNVGHLGWIPPPQRDGMMNAAHSFAMVQMLPFPLMQDLPDGFKLMLTDTWKHQQAVKYIGKPYTGSHQETGSCVNSGAQNVMMTLLAINILQNGLQEKFVVPFTLLAYGKSRQIAGMRGRGEGSLGSTMAQALKQFGILDAAEPGLPPYTTTNGFDWGSQAELAWSDGGAVAQKWLDLAKANTVSSAEIKTTQELASSIANLCPVTTASMKWCQPGTEKLVGSGENAVVIGRRTGTGGHQTSVLGVWKHPSEGLLFWRQNNWGDNAYKVDPSTGLGSGYWSPENEEQAALNEGGAEYFAFSGPMGFITQEPTWRVL